MDAFKIIHTLRTYAIGNKIVILIEKEEHDIVVTCCDPQKLDFISETVSAASLFSCSQKVKSVLHRTHPSKFLFYPLFIVVVYVTLYF